MLFVFNTNGNKIIMDVYIFIHIKTYVCSNVKQKIFLENFHFVCPHIVLKSEGRAGRSYVGIPVYKKKTQLVYFEIVRINHKKCLLVLPPYYLYCLQKLLWIFLNQILKDIFNFIDINIYGSEHNFWYFPLNNFRTPPSFLI